MTPSTITLMGQDAATVGLAANRQPEVLLGDSWRTANGMPMVNRMLRLDPNCVRLIAPARNLAEDVLKTAIPMDDDLKARLDEAIEQWCIADAAKANALAIIRSEL